MSVSWWSSKNTVPALESIILKHLSHWRLSLRVSLSITRLISKKKVLKHLSLSQFPSVWQVHKGCFCRTVTFFQYTTNTHIQYHMQMHLDYLKKCFEFRSRNLWRSAGHSFAYLFTWTVIGIRQYISFVKSLL